MKYREIGKTGIHASVLGLGCMRLPVVEGENSIDSKAATEMLHEAIDSGINYIDTAYPYHNGMSEVFLGEALKNGYREKVTLITKLPIWLCEKEEDFDRYLNEQLSRLQTDVIDIYLLHAVNQERWDQIVKIGIFDFIEKAKKDGRIKHIGFSFHDQYSTFETVLNAYPWDVCMLQLNYMDMQEQAGYAGLKAAEEKGVPVIVMEPLKGGLLASPSDDIRAIWTAVEPSWSPVEWAFRYIANEPNVKVVLSGMSNMAQLRENIDIANRLDAHSLSDKHLQTVEEVRKTYVEKIKVPCTQCQYCMPCPFGVDIPRAFTYYNRASIFNAYESLKQQYLMNVPEASRADCCVSCGACEPKCPQNISIIQCLTDVKSAFV